MHSKGRGDTVHNCTPGMRIKLWTFIQCTMQRGESSFLVGTESSGCCNMVNPGRQWSIFPRLAPQELQNDRHIHSRFQLLHVERAMRLIKEEPSALRGVCMHNRCTRDQWAYRLMVDGSLTLFFHFEGGLDKKTDWCPLR